MSAEMELPLHMRLTEWPRRPGCLEPIQGHRIRLKASLVDFTEFVPIYGSKFVSKLLDGFARASAEGRLAGPQAAAHAFAGFLRMVASATAQDSCGNQSHLNRLYEALRDHGSVDRADVEASIVSFIERARDLDDVSLFGPITPRTRNNKIVALRTAARELGPDLGWHGLHVPKAFGLWLRTTRTPTPSLGEIRLPQDREATGRSAVEVMCTGTRPFDRGLALALCRQGLTQAGSAQARRHQGGITASRRSGHWRAAKNRIFRQQSMGKRAIPATMVAG